MKNVLVLLLSTLMSAQSFAALNLDYGSMLKEVSACRKSIYGCTTEQELDIASFNGTILNSYDLENYLSEDSEKSIFVPLALDNPELITLAAATSLGIIAFKNDQDIMDVVQRHKSSTTAQITSIGNFLGNRTAAFSISAGSYFIGLCFENNTLKKAGLFMIGASLATSIVAIAAKTAFGRARPRADEGPYSFFNSGAKSFYSGHTTEVFTIATVISEMYKEDFPIVPYVAYGVAAITAYARMHDNAHWASDVIAGAVAGHLITKLVMNAMNSNKDGRNGVKIYPGTDPLTGTHMLYFEWKEKEKITPFKCSKMPEGAIKTHVCFTEGFTKLAR